jgi:hypothetical protein
LVGQHWAWTKHAQHVHCFLSSEPRTNRPKVHAETSWRFEAQRMKTHTNWFLQKLISCFLPIYNLNLS